MNAGGLILTIAIFALGLAIAFLLGSIPFGLIIGKKVKGVDIREYGSGNIGSTNTARVLGIKAGLITFALDTLKGSIAVLIMMGLSKLCLAWVSSPDELMILLSNGFLGSIMVALSMGIVVIGHMYSPFLSGKGGKGIATTFGAMIPVSPLTAAICLAIFILLVLITKRVSIGSIIGIMFFPVGMFLWKEQIAFGIVAIVVTALAIFAHRSNIKRIFKGEEPKFSFKGSLVAEQGEGSGE